MLPFTHRSLAAAAFTVLSVGTVSPQTPTLVRDINIEPADSALSSSPDQFVEFGGHLYFTATDPRLGTELFRTDGTAAGTGLFVDLAPGVEDSEPRGLTVAGNRMFFVADTLFETLMFVTDGTEAGTHPIRAGFNSPGLEMGALGNRVVFAARTNEHGIEPWISDGTDAGTRILEDLREGSLSSAPREFLGFDNKIVFSGNDGLSGQEPWITDGSEVTLVRDIAIGPGGSNPKLLGRAAAGLVIGAANGLYVTDGTWDGTQRLIGSISRVFDPALENGNYVYFVGQTSARGAELWRTDGTPAGTELVRDIAPGTASSTPLPLGVVGDKVVVRAAIGARTELWVTDGTSAGTELVMGLGITNVDNTAQFSDQVLFTGNDGGGATVWRTNGTTTGTYQVEGSGSAPLLGRTWNGNAYYAATDARGSELWRSDGARSRLFADLAVRPPGSTESSTPRAPAQWNNQVAFLASETDHVDLWLSDGTNSGTTRSHVFPGATPFAPRSSNADHQWLLPAVDKLFAFANGNGNALGLWCDRGSGFEQILDLPFGPNYWEWLTLGDLAIIATQDLWFSDGTRSGTQIIRINQMGSSNPQQLTLVGAEVFFFAYDGVRYSLYRTTGDTPIRVFDFIAFPFLPAENMFAVDDKVYFSVTVNTSGRELWVSDGTTAGTQMIVDVNAGAASSNPVPLANFGGLCLFRANDAVHGEELWITNGTAATTVRMADIRPGTAGSQIRNAVTLGSDRVVFSANDGVIGTELWAFSSGVSLVADLATGSFSSEPRMLTVVGDQVYFIADSSDHGLSLWRSNGFASGTEPVLQLLEEPNILVAVGDHLYFDNPTIEHGRELWRLGAGATTEVLGNACGTGSRAPILRANDPVIGIPWRVRGRGGHPSSGSLVLIGRPDTTPSVLFENCVGWIDPSSFSVLHQVADAANLWSLQFRIPAAPELVGVQFALQSFSASPTGVEASHGLWSTIGAR